MGFERSLLGFGIGMMVDSRQVLGKLPECQMLLKILKSVLSEVSGSCFRNW